MESYLPITFLNDFIFCPRSIYFHQLYGRTNKKNYQRASQTKGLVAHKTVDTKTYSSSNSILQGMEIYSHTYNLAGKLDTFDETKKLLSERKKKITTIYDGYIFQLYAQYFCLIDMGFSVEKLRLYSLDDNKAYPIKLPKDDPEMFDKFKLLLKKVRNFDLENSFQPNPNKCKHCIYNNLCDYALLEPC